MPRPRWHHKPAVPPGSHLSPQDVFLVAWSISLQTPGMSAKRRIGRKDWSREEWDLVSYSGSNTST